MRIEDIKINGITNPVGFELDHPKVSWKVRESVSKRAKNVLIEVSKKADFSEKSRGLIWTVQDRLLQLARNHIPVITAGSQ